MKKIEYLVIPLVIAMVLLATGLSAAVSANTAVPFSARPPVLAMATAPSMGTASSFAVLAGSTATNTGPTVISGDLGVWPGSAITGFADVDSGPGTVTEGTIHAGDAVAQQAQTDVTAAYISLAGQECDSNLTSQDLGGQTLTPGVYCFDTSAQLTGALTLNAEGDPGAVFVFKIGSTLTTASNSSVSVINSGTVCNVFWQIGSSATLGTGTTFVGSILALESITLTTDASIDGQALARNGAVTMDTNDIDITTCWSGPAPTVVPTEVVSPTAEVTVSPTATNIPTSAPTSAPVAAPATETPATVSLTPTAEAVQALLPAAGVAGAAGGSLGGVIAGATVGLSAVVIWLRRKNRA